MIPFMIRIEDNFEDVLSKSMSGLGISLEALAQSTGTEPSVIESLLQGELDEAALLAVASPLGLSPKKLLDMAQRRWMPQVQLPENIQLINTPFPVPGYEEMTVNSYLIWSGKTAIAIDTGADAAPLLKAVTEQGLQLEALYITHTHRDHIAALDPIRAAHPGIAVYSPTGEALPNTVALHPGATLNCGDLSLQTRETSGHSPGALSYILSGAENPVAFVGDALFCLSMGKAPRAAYAQALENNRRELLSLPDDTRLCPGHGPVTTVADEKARNPFF
jgi:glyoxylase-like metal-dependent hydrolase (beta-lactamase superfamily II)